MSDHEKKFYVPKPGEHPNAWVGDVTVKSADYDPAEFYFSTRDDDKQSCPISYRHGVAMHRFVEICVADPTLPFRTNSDFHRDAECHEAARVRYLSKNPATQAAATVLMAELDIQRQLEQHARITRHPEELGKMCETLFDDESWHIMADVLQAQKVVINTFPEPHKSRSMATWEKWKSRLDTNRSLQAVPDLFPSITKENA